MKRSEVFEVNKTISVLNWVCNNIWFDKSIKESIKQTLAYYKEDIAGLELDITIKEVKEKYRQYILKCINDKQYLKNELEKERKAYASPSFKNIKEFFKWQHLPFTTIEDYQTFLVNNVINNF